MNYHLNSGTLSLDDQALLSKVSEHITLEPDATSAGVFVRTRTTVRNQYWWQSLGVIENLHRFVACARGITPFWMEPRVGAAMNEIPGDTQWLLAQRTDSRYLLVVPLIDQPLRFTLDGRGGFLRLWADTADAFTVRDTGIGAFIAVGSDPYALQEQGARAVAQHLKTVRLRSEKALPDFVENFGWCTWDAFYRDVSSDKVRTGLQTFRDGGVEPRWLILDDGWLSAELAPFGGDRLTSFEAHATKFPGGLSPVVKMAKQEFSVRHVIAWHAFVGYWSGIDPAKFPKYTVHDLPRREMPLLGRDATGYLQAFGLVCSTIAPESIDAFFDDFHTFLAAQGIDGVKVDNQSSLEWSVDHLGGRVTAARAYRQALEKSVHTHFQGRLINCMSNGNEMFYLTHNSTVMRTSDDFWPNRPESHGMHLFTNAHVGMWFGQFVHPDWDMFQSGHAMGSFHAAGRAISGAPVYVSDKPEAHDFALLRKIVCTDGSILRCEKPGLPSPECLLHDPTREPVLLKIFNTNTQGSVLGVFNALYDKNSVSVINGSVSLRDVPGLSDQKYAVLSHRTGDVRVMSGNDTWAVTLNFGEWDIFTFMPLHQNRAVLGLSDKLNSGAAIRDLRHTGNRSEFHIRDAGTLVLYAATKPKAITAGTTPVAFEHDAKTSRVTATIPSAGLVSVTWN